MPYYRSTEVSSRAQNKEREDLLMQKYPKVTRNFFTNCDVAYGLDRLNLLWKVHTSLGDTAPSGDFTNLDYVHGFLLAEDFVQQRDGRPQEYPAYINRDQYLTMSASVLFANRGVNEYMDFMKSGFKQVGEVVGSFKETRVLQVSDSDSDSSDSDGEGLNKNMLDVAKMFATNRVTTAVFANIANVPIYNVDARSNAEGDIFVSTLNEALSVNSSFISLLARSLHVKKELQLKGNEQLGFGFVHGRETPKKQEVTGLNEHTYTAPAADNGTQTGRATKEGWSQLAKDLTTAEQMGALPINFITSSRQAQEGQDMIIRKSYSVSDANIVTRVRDQITGANYIPKNDKARILITEGARNRTSLISFAPTSRRSANEGTLRETTIMSEIQVPREIRVGKGSNANVIKTAQYPEEDIQAYYQMLGIA
jgi:hypothetical protein